MSHLGYGRKDDSTGAPLTWPGPIVVGRSALKEEVGLVGLPGSLQSGEWEPGKHSVFLDPGVDAQGGKRQEEEAVRPDATLLKRCVASCPYQDGDSDSWGKLTRKGW